MRGADVDALEVIADFPTSELRQRLEHRGFDEEIIAEVLARREDTYYALRIATLLGMVKD